MPPSKSSPKRTPFLPSAPSSIGKTALFAAFCYQLGYDFLLMTDYGNHGVNFIYPWQSLEIMKKIKMI